MTLPPKGPVRPRRAHTKKKAYRLACHEAARKGLVNTDSGSWVNNDGAGSMRRDFKGGHRA